MCYNLQIRSRSLLKTFFLNYCNLNYYLVMGKRSLLRISLQKKFVNHHYIKNGFLVDHYYYNQNIENGFLVDHYIENHCLLSSSLLQKSERRKECEKNIKSLSFCLIFTLTTYGISTYGVLAKKNFKLSNLT
jgi:hypothetical protein